MIAQVSPSDVETLQNYALLLRSPARRDLHRAADCYERALKVSPSHPTVLVSFAQLLEEVGALERAEEMFRRGASSGNVEVCYDGAFCLEIYD